MSLALMGRIGAHAPLQVKGIPCEGGGDFMAFAKRRSFVFL
jgi:hypothetical protein